MKEIEFTWDNRKNKANAKKHNVSFEEAQSVFYDEQAKDDHERTLQIWPDEGTQESLYQAP